MADIASIPRGAPLMRMRWRHVLFMHWRVDAAALRPLVPRVFEIDAFDGSAWIGLVPFTMEDVSPACLPRVPLRSVTDFHECNVRTYVRCGGERGVYFFSLDAASRIGVWAARTFFHLPYMNARIDLAQRDGEIEYRVNRLAQPRAAMHCRWRIGRVRDAAQPGDLAHFLTERYQLMTMDPHGRPLRCRIWHEPWPLREAELLSLHDELVPAAGITLPTDSPVTYHANTLNVRAWPPEPIT